MGLEGPNARFFQERLERIDRSDDPRRQAVEQVGSTWKMVKDGERWWKMVKSDRSNGEGNDSALSPGRRSRYGAQAQLNGLCRRIHDRCQGATGRGLGAILRLDQEH